MNPLNVKLLIGLALGFGLGTALTALYYKFLSHELLLGEVLLKKAKGNTLLAFAHVLNYGETLAKDVSKNPFKE